MGGGGYQFTVTPARRNVANQRSYVIIIVRKEGGAWERSPQ